MTQCTPLCLPNRPDTHCLCQLEMTSATWSAHEHCRVSEAWNKYDNTISRLTPSNNKYLHTYETDGYDIQLTTAIISEWAMKSITL